MLTVGPTDRGVGAYADDVLFNEVVQWAIAHHVFVGCDGAEGGASGGFSTWESSGGRAARSGSGGFSTSESSGRRAARSGSAERNVSGDSYIEAPADTDIIILMNVQTDIDFHRGHRN